MPAEAAASSLPGWMGSSAVALATASAPKLPAFPPIACEFCAQQAGPCDGGDDAGGDDAGEQLGPGLPSVAKVADAPLG